MNITIIIQLFQTLSYFIISIAILVLISSLVLKNLHIKYKDFEVDAKLKQKKKKRKK